MPILKFFVKFKPACTGQALDNRVVEKKPFVSQGDPAILSAAHQAALDQLLQGFPGVMTIKTSDQVPVDTPGKAQSEY